MRKNYLTWEINTGVVNEAAMGNDATSYARVKL